uniref:Uncharacterized protein n=1 Tax=Lepeophtheirus salmonis TaxID=72036 RepID=A0A0K2TIB9_LEPSM
MQGLILSYLTCLFKTDETTCLAISIFFYLLAKKLSFSFHSNFWDSCLDGKSPICIASSNR